DRAQRLAGALVERGVQRGDRVAVLAPNTHLLLEAHYGVQLAGAVLVTLNTRLSAAEIQYILEHSGARLVLVDELYRELLVEAADGQQIISSVNYDRLVAAAPRHRRGITDERSLPSLNRTHGTPRRPQGDIYERRG